MPHSGYAIAADGSPIFFRLDEPGREDAPTVVFCDGIGCDGFVWRHLRGALHDDHRLVHFHYRGHGRTPEPRDRGRVAIEDFADDLVAVLDETHSPDAIVFGHSLGVQVALEAYRRHRSRVRGLVLVCGAPGKPLATFRGTGALEVALPLLRRAADRAPRLWNRMARTLVPTKLGWDLATLFEINGARVDRLHFMEYLRGLSHVEIRFFLSVLERAKDHSAIDMLPSIAAPTLIIAGDSDGFTPSALSERMHQDIPSSELHTVVGGSHVAPLEHPDEVIAVVREFVSRRIAS